MCDIEDSYSIIKHVVDKNPTTKQELNNIMKHLNKQYGITLSYPKLLEYYKKSYDTYDPCLLKLLQKNPIRSQSGVMVYAIFTEPFYKDTGNGKMKAFSCKYDCSYCPEQPNQPRSYLLNEPGVLRANKVNFDTVQQIYVRNATYKATGHPNDKCEFIILGGTWHSYPIEYRYEFMRNIYYGANTTDNHNGRERLSLSEEMKLNETAECKIIGLTIETRPDEITPQALIEMREMGVTRVQLGVQHTNERLLHRINRGCGNRHAINAIQLLKDNCFKIDIHLMPDLPKPYIQGTTEIDENFDSVAEDYKMFHTVITDHRWKVDQWKIYPCEVVPYTKIQKDYENGLYKPYGHQQKREFNELHELLIWVQTQVPRWIRLNRIIRDIPHTYIEGGIKDSSMRQTLDNEMKKRGLTCHCMRCCEIGKKVCESPTKLYVEEYEASNGFEYFISICDESQKHLFGFLRLRLTTNAGKYKGKIVFEELVNSAFIRELHVYGQTLPTTTQTHFSGYQHKGYGKMLIQKAIEIAQLNNYKKISVISGNGVKEYYRKHGFIDGTYYLHKSI